MKQFLKHSKTFIALLLAMIMLLGTALTANAEVSVAPSADESSELTLKQIIVVAGGVFLALLLFILICAFFKRNRKYNKFRKSLLVNDLDETVELYEDLKPLEWGAPDTVFVDGELPENVIIDESIGGREGRGPRVTVKYDSYDDVTVNRKIGYVEEIPDEGARKAISRVDALIPEVLVMPEPIVVRPENEGAQFIPIISVPEKKSAKNKVKGVDPMVLAAFGIKDEADVKPVSEAQGLVMVPVIDDSEPLEKYESASPELVIAQEDDTKQSEKINSNAQTHLSVEEEVMPQANSFLHYGSVPQSFAGGGNTYANPSIAPMFRSVPFVSEKEIQYSQPLSEMPVVPIISPEVKEEAVSSEAPAPIVIPIPSADEVKKQEPAFGVDPFTYSENREEAALHNTLADDLDKYDSEV